MEINLKIGIEEIPISSIPDHGDGNDYCPPTRAWIVEDSIVIVAIAYDDGSGEIFTASIVHGMGGRNVIPKWAYNDSVWTSWIRHWDIGDSDEPEVKVLERMIKSRILGKYP